MYKIVYDEDQRRKHAEEMDAPVRFSDVFARVPLSIKEQEMARMTFDGLLLQSNLSEGEVLSIEEIAVRMFTREGEMAGKIAMSRAKQAALNLVALGNAKPVPNRKEMTHIKSCGTPGAQLAAVMNLSVRRSVQNRRETDTSMEVDGQTNTTAESQTPIKVNTQRMQ